MHEKLLHRIGGRLTHLHHTRSPATARSEPGTLGLDPVKVGRFGAGTLGAEDEAVLAGEVADHLPHGWDLPHKPEEALHEVITHLGGEDALMQWLDRYPGRPRLTARIYVLLGLLDQYSDAPAVLKALRTSRGQEPYPEGLRDFLVPQTDEETLSDLGYRVEQFLAEGQVENAVALALATADWLRASLTGPEAVQTGVGDLAALVTSARDDIEEAAAAATGTWNPTPS
ncbi:hypothetical protein O7599_04220 [Streptomyces sp. WMMC500]|uniref:hypothetical protein n=1 Tax=Streptomyces sp. WMMC500 TaxID=3015154 RepID=UPI00248B1FFA|nr:hypothetical protein [Streptomyces sp. WMMC500]WBB61766.1 hypothetical protein O7599_04220 [Streptomyces sp. WMMC500]